MQKLSFRARMSTPKPRCRHANYFLTVTPLPFFYPFSTSILNLAFWWFQLKGPSAENNSLAIFACQTACHCLADTLAGKFAKQAKMANELFSAHGPFKVLMGAQVYQTIARKPPVRFGSVRFLHEPVPVPTVPVLNPVPPVPVPTGSAISAHSDRSHLRTETSRGVFFGPPKQPKNAPQTPKTKNAQNSCK